LVQITQKINATTWVVNRGVHGANLNYVSPTSHNAGTALVPLNAGANNIQPCTGHGGPTLQIWPPDTCIDDQATRTSQVSQYSLLSDESVPGSNSRTLTYGLVGYRNMFYFANAKALPDGSWVCFLVTQPDGNSAQVWMAKMPPLPAPDGIDRTNFIQVPVSIGSFPGAVSASVRYGYEEDGAVTNFYCRQRRQTCAVPATLGSSVNVPGIPQRVLYYCVQYLDGSNNVIGQSKVAAVVVDQAQPTAPSPPRNAPKQTR
jgi:hypothetical protein